MSDQSIVPFPSSGEEGNSQQENVNGYPVIPGYLLQDEGLYTEITRESDGVKRYSRIAQLPVWVKAQAYFGPENAEQWLAVLCAKNRLGKVIEITMYLSDLYCTRQTWSQKLARHGIIIDTECAPAVREYLIRCLNNSTTSVYVETTGGCQAS